MANKRKVDRKEDDSHDDVALVIVGGVVLCAAIGIYFWVYKSNKGRVLDDIAELAHELKLVRYDTETNHVTLIHKQLRPLFENTFGMFVSDKWRNMYAGAKTEDDVAPLLDAMRLWQRYESTDIADELKTRANRSLEEIAWLQRDQMVLHVPEDMCATSGVTFSFDAFISDMCKADLADIGNAIEDFSVTVRAWQAASDTDKWWDDNLAQVATHVFAVENRLALLRHINAIHQNATDIILQINMAISKAISYCRDTQVTYNIVSKFPNGQFATQFVQYLNEEIAKLTALYPDGEGKMDVDINRANLNATLAAVNDEVRLFEKRLFEKRAEMAEFLGSISEFLKPLPEFAHRVATEATQLIHDQGLRDQYVSGITCLSLIPSLTAVAAVQKLIDENTPVQAMSEDRTPLAIAQEIVALWGKLQQTTRDNAQKLAQKFKMEIPTTPGDWLRCSSKQLQKIVMPVHPDKAQNDTLATNVAALVLELKAIKDR